MGRRLHPGCHDSEKAMNTKPTNVSSQVSVFHFHFCITASPRVTCVFSLACPLEVIQIPCR